MNQEEIETILEQHIPIDNSLRCICGWRATPEARRNLGQFALHRKHLAAALKGDEG